MREPASKPRWGSATSRQVSGIAEQRLRTDHGTVAMGTPALESLGLTATMAWILIPASLTAV